MNTSKKCVILALGFAKWRGSDPRALSQSFRKQGHTLIEIDAEDFIPWKWNGFVTRVFRRLFIKSLVGDYNREVLKYAESSVFDFILVFKGLYLSAETLSKLRTYGKPIYNFYPDVSFVDHGSDIPKGLSYYDCVFTTKSFHGESEVKEFSINEMIHVRHGFDPEVHRPIVLTQSQIDRYGCDVSFVGCWSPWKEHLISHIVENRKQVKVLVYGIGWNHASSKFKNLLGSNIRHGVFGDELAVVYNASKINLGILSKAASNYSIADQTTVRTFQIPASRSFMLHEDTQEVRRYFDPRREIMLFRNEIELLEKIDMILNDDNLRKVFIDNGYQRAIKIPYDYTDAANKILEKYSTSINNF